MKVSKFKRSTKNIIYSASGTGILGALLCIFLIFDFSTGQAQGWDLFVENQESTYGQDRGDRMQLYFLDHDTTVIDNDRETWHFNTEGDIGMHCAIEIVFFLMDWGYDPPFFLGYSYAERMNDSVSFYLGDLLDHEPMIFKPYSGVGESWTTNGITISCTDLGIQDVLGTMDSIKRFSFAGNGYDGVEFILSKNYGLIQFLPSKYFRENVDPNDLPPYYELIGYRNNNISLGYRRPTYEDYFHLSAGDVIYWADTVRQWGPDFIYRITSSKDSIIHVTSDSNAITYDYMKTRYDENGNVVDQRMRTRTHSRAAEGKVVENSFQWYGVMSSLLYWGDDEVFLTESLYFTVEQGDTITRVESYFPELLFELAGCDISWTADDYHDYTYSTRTGLYKEYDGWLGGYTSSEVVGSKIDGVVMGETDVLTSSIDLELENAVVYPNPTEDVLLIQTAEPGVYRIDLFAVSGRLVLSQVLSDSQVDLSPLEAGVYTMVLTDEYGRELRKKIIKK